MLIPYPLNPVITDNRAFSALYDADPESLNLVSVCLSAAQAQDLLAQGAQFSSVLFLDGAGQRLMSQLKRADQGDAERGAWPEIVELVLQRLDAEGVTQIHAAFGRRGSGEFFAAGG